MHQRGLRELVEDWVEMRLNNALESQRNPVLALL
jgi:hypothetical protein